MLFVKLSQNAANLVNNLNLANNLTFYQYLCVPLENTRIIMKKALILASVAVLALLTSCNLMVDSVVPEYSQISVPAVGGEIDIKVVSSGSWTSRLSGTIKATLTPNRGESGSTTVKVVFPENTDTVALAGAIVYETGKCISNTQIFQSRYVKPDFKVVRISTNELTSNGGSINYSVTSNVPWTVSCADSKDVKFNSTGSFSNNGEYSITTSMTIEFPANNTGAPVTYDLKFETLQKKDDVEVHMYETVAAE